MVSADMPSRILSTLLLLFVTLKLSAQQQPNVLVIVADDLGYVTSAVTAVKSTLRTLMLSLTTVCE